MSDGGVTDAGSSQAYSVKIDWRTGKPMVAYDDAFWQEHERRGVEQGLSIRQYCSTHGLALSTYRHRVSGRRRSGGARSAPGAMAASPPFVEVTRSQPMPASVIEVVLQCVTLRLTGEPAQQVLARVLDKHKVFGPRGEALSALQPELWQECVQIPVPPEAFEEVKGHRRRRSGRPAIDPDLPRRRVEHDLSDQEKAQFARVVCSVRRSPRRWSARPPGSRCCSTRG